MIWDVPRYLPRGLERLFDDPDSLRKVVVVQGPRAVGKTRMAQHLVENGYLNGYHDLSDPTTRLEAKSDLDGWLRRLSRPLVIDEAQLIAELPLAVKRLVDELEPGLHVVLTGSAAIHRTGLGGSDPLTGRAERHLLRPFTAQEAAGLAPTTPSLADLLFVADVLPSSTRMTTDEPSLIRAIERGGLPAELLAQRSTRSAGLDRVGDDVRAALRPDLRAEDRFDAGRAADLLDSVTRLPGGLLNLDRLSRELGFDRRTVERLLDVLQDRFLIDRLPNLALAASRQLLRNAKVHPADTSISAVALARAGVDLRDDRHVFGAMLESWVAQQLLSSITWSDRDIRAWYWRRTTRPTAEVDLVLESDGLRVAIETKAARSLSGDDIRGIDALAAEMPIHRAFIAYQGNEVHQLRSNVWAVPVQALLDGSVFDQEDHRVTPPITVAAEQISHDGDATMLVSYVRADDQTLGGAMTRFARDLVAMYRLRTGRTIDLFIDTADLGWGRVFEDQLKRAAQQTTFLLAMVTPGYFRSEACRSEFQQFLESAATSPSARERLVLSLLWSPIDGLVDESDPIVREVRRRQYLSGEHLLTLEPGSGPYVAALVEIADALRQTVDQRESAPQAQHTTGGSPEKGHEDDDSLDLMESLAMIQEAQEPIEGAAAALGEGMQEIGRIFGDTPALPANDTYASAAALARLGTALSQPVDRIDRAADVLSETWDGLEQRLGTVVEALGALGTDGDRQALADSMRELAESLKLPGIDEFGEQARLLGRLSRHLRPLSRSLQNALRVLDTVRRGADALAVRMSK